ncbi:hypothetical protein [Spirulina sp. 06S082]|uniref:hypothetical protein n=1 Tax=Spirulina sp. 06S082 TaxID=3110248 RepID=UPI002B202E75|nr:hypothetical protein [Spirulina sp. 06S082]MEA5467235.1 hypothetical protein [Spirulina sp. 06S082]
MFYLSEILCHSDRTTSDRDRIPHPAEIVTQYYKPVVTLNMGRQKHSLRRCKLESNFKRWFSQFLLTAKAIAVHKNR